MRSAFDTSRGSSAGRRAHAASIALLLVAVQSAGMGHLLLARHVVCPEHGELVHADAAGAVHAHGGVAAAAAPARGRAISTGHGDASAEHADEHCAVLGSRREHAIVPAAYQALSAASEGTAVETPAAANPQYEARPRYDVAPKQSPPV